MNSIQASTLEGVLSEGSTYRTSSAYGIVVRVSSITYSVGATVEVCRAERSRENDIYEFCYDGLDNDCDGRYVSVLPAGLVGLLWRLECPIITPLLLYCRLN